MHRRSREEIVDCADCGQPLDVDRERGYRATPEWSLCLACAIERGAQFDEEMDRWTVAPDLSGLPFDVEYQPR